ncbi:Retrovirus-related Pol polyprotein from transposon 297 [Vitis vinifera]|uniref:Retrovirus-related Pol polyprotein from transposon 297 n=1 Tax=Vitis vinifera TaxID=29760 RepID=A0A438JQZ3_VITVI|nr:Retrovirus-related Pol polyprotein from transposon 297 [Vitis vinifera]
MDMIDIGRIFDAASCGPHTAFDMFGVSVLEAEEDDSIPDAYIDDMDFIGIGRILNVAPHGPHSAFDIFGVFVLDDESVLDVVTSDFTFIKGASDSVDPPLSSDTMSDTTTHIYDVDDVGDMDDPLGGQSECDSDTKDEKVHPFSGSTELIDFGAPNQPREIRIGSSLSPDERSRLIDLLRSYLDVFAWSYEDMPGLDPSIVHHHLPILPHARPVKQKSRRLHPQWSLQVKEEIRKQLSVGFLSVVEYPEWLANVVPVPKKDGKVRVCVDFRDLNKANLKDDFPLPHIDMLVDSTTGHPMLSFMDGFSGYNQILMALEDMERLLSLLSGVLTATGLCHLDVKVYVDDMIVKSRDRTDHLAALQRFFERIRQFRLRLNPKKCTFGVASGKLLGHIVSERGIEIDPEKIRAILDMPAPRTEKEIKGFLGRLQISLQFGSDDCQRTFERIKECLISPPVLVPPTPGRPLLLYLSISDMALGCMLAQLDDLGKERAIYYLSKRMFEYECKYIMMSTFAWHWPVLTGRLIRWLVLLTEFDIHYVTQKSVKGSVVADHLASLSISDDRSVDDDFPDEQIISMTSITGWRLYFDGAANQSGFGIVGDPRGFQFGYTANSGYIHLPRAENQFADALATLASMIVIPVGVTVRPLLIKTSFLSCGTYPESTSAKDRRALRQLATRFVICGDVLYRRSPEWSVIIMSRPYICRSSDERGSCRVWGVDIIGKISPKSSSGHEYILVAIDYFTKGEVDTSIQEYGIQHHKSSAYKPQTNGAVEAANKNIKRILRKMVENSRDWSKKLLVALWAYRTSFRTSIGATPYSLVYGMEAVLPVEIEMRSLRITLEQHASEAEWVQSRYDQLSLLDEKRLRATDHAQAYQRKMTCAFRKRVRPRKFQRGDLVLKVLRGLISDPRGKFRRVGVGLMSSEI